MREDGTFLCVVYCICLELFFWHVKEKPSEPTATQGKMQFYRSVNHLSVFRYVQCSVAALRIYVTKASLPLVLDPGYMNMLTNCMTHLGFLPDVQELLLRALGFAAPAPEWQRWLMFAQVSSGANLVLDLVLVN